MFAKSYHPLLYASAMPQFNVYERNPDHFTDGFDESYGAQIEQHINGNGNGNGNGEEHPDEISLMADALAWILSFCWNRRGGPPQPRAAFHRFAAISLVLRPDLVELTPKQMAAKLRVTKATLSWHSLAFSDKCGLHFRPSRRESARRTFSRAQKKVWRERRAG